MILTNEYVQNCLSEAESILSKSLAGKSLEDSPRVHLLCSLFVAMREYSASGNSIPGLAGLGLHETVKLAEDVISAGSISEREVVIKSYLGVAKAFIL